MASDARIFAALLFTIWCSRACAEDSDETCDASGKCGAALEYASSPPCYFPTTLLEVPVTSVKQLTATTKLISFGLPVGTSLSLAVSSAILMNVPGGGKDGKDLVRPYNPVSPNTQLGSFDLLVKIYPEGIASKYIDKFTVGDLVAFKQVKGNVKAWRYPFGKESITMVAGGTGIAPMYQALLPLLQTPGDTTKVRLIFGNRDENDILLKSELDKMAADHPDRLEITYVVGETANDSSALARGWQGEVGWVDEDKLKRFAFPPAAGTVVWICGVDDLYKSLAGGRLTKGIKAGSALHNLGYTEEMVWRS